MLQKLRTIIPGRLSAIEIAEGALLADIAVVLKLLTIYLPIAGGYITLLVPLPFTVLVLRRNLYTGIMGLCVAFFVVGMLTGLHFLSLMLLEAGAGLFLGVMMKYRIRDILLVLVGTLGSGLLLTGLLVLVALLSGVPISRSLIYLHRNYDAFAAFLGFVAAHIGLGSWWKHSIFPFVISFETLLFTYWWLLYYLISCIFLCPIVIVVTYITNFLVRLLGYDVRPFPDGVLNKLLRWIMHIIIRLAIKLGLGNHWLTGALIKEIRRRGISRNTATWHPQIVPAQHNGHPQTHLEAAGTWHPQGPHHPTPPPRATTFRLAPHPARVPSAPSSGDGVVTPDVVARGGRVDAEGHVTCWINPHSTDESALYGGCQIAHHNDAWTDAPLIDIQHVTYTYPDQKTHALQDVSLQVQRGEYLVILGHNGSGKSTLARHCNALLTPTSGQVLVAGLDTRDQARQRAIRDMVGMIFQNPDNQIIATVVEDDVAWALTVRGLPASLITERVEQAMAAVGISDLRELAPHRLSGGQRQRLAIAGVLALRPQCIIADEATSQLDPLSRREIVALLHQLQQEHGLTIIQVTHLLEEAAQAQRIVVMEQGQIVMEGTPATIFADLEQLRRLKLAIPAPIELAARLRGTGRPIAREAVTVEAIAQELVP